MEHIIPILLTVAAAVIATALGQTFSGQLTLVVEWAMYFVATPIVIGFAVLCGIQWRMEREWKTKQV